MIGTYSTFGESRGRRRGTVRSALARVLLGFAAVAAVGGYGYQVGVSAGQTRAEQLETDLERFQRDNLELRDQLARTVQTASETQRSLDALHRQYAADVPQGEVASLVEDVQAQLDAGVEVERLAFLIEAAGHPPQCLELPVTKRFAPRTPVTQGPVSAVRFADRIVVTGTGSSALRSDGLAEAWYDAAKPVRVEFRTPDGQTAGVEGVLPLTHAMVVDGREYRFSMIATGSAFVEIAGQACALP